MNVKNVIAIYSRVFTYVNDSCHDNPTSASQKVSRFCLFALQSYSNESFRIIIHEVLPNNLQHPV